MKVFENIEAYRAKLVQTHQMSSSDITVLCFELKRIIEDLVPLRNNRAATQKYFDVNLRHDYNEQEFLRSNAEKELNGMPIENNEYIPTENECIISEDILHDALITVLKDDRYSFGHLYWMLCSRYNRIAGYAFYDDIVISNKTIDYAIEFDVEQLRAEFGKPGDVIDRLDYLELRLADSAAFEGDETDKAFVYLKNRFEKVVKDMMAILEHRLEKVGYPVHKNSGQIREVPAIEDSIGLIEDGDANYITYFDFSACPVDVSSYPFSIHLGTYKVVRTSNGLEDESPILIDIFTNVYRQIAYANNDAAQDIFNDTRRLLTSLFELYVKRTCQIHRGDFGTVITTLKWWAMQVVKCLAAAFKTDVLPESHYGVNEDLRANAWEHCILYQESMAEFALLLPLVFLNDLKNNPYKDVHSVIPYNFYGQNYSEVTSAANSKHFKNQSERIATEYKENCKHLKTYLCERLHKLDGKGVNDKDAVNERHLLIEDMVTMANDYLEHLKEANIQKSSHIKYAFDLWIWYVREINDSIVKSQFGMNNCGTVMDIWKTEDEATAALNTGKQYADYVVQYNRESVRLQRTLQGIYAKMEKDEQAAPSEIGEERIEAPELQGRQTPGITFIGKLDTNEQAALMQYFKDRFVKKKAFEAFAVIKVAANLGYIKEPSFSDIQSSFPNFKGTEQNYSGFVGMTGKFTTDISKRHRKLLDSCEEEIAAILKESTKELE